MSKLRFIKLRLIWHVLRGHSVGWKLKYTPDSIGGLTDAGLIADCLFVFPSRETP